MPHPLFESLCTIGNELEFMRDRLCLPQGGLWHRLNDLLASLDQAIDTLASLRDDDTPARVAAREVPDA